MSPSFLPSTINMTWVSVSHHTILGFCLTSYYPSIFFFIFLLVLQSKVEISIYSDMGFIHKFSYILSLLVLIPTLCSSQDTFVCSSGGACGYGGFGRNINGGDVGAVTKLYRDGTGCGACYQVRCTQPQFCKENGVNIVVTDHGQGDNTDFILSPSGFVKLSRPNMAAELIAQGVIEIEYKRVSCQYPGYNLMFKIHEQSKFPDYLAIIFLYQAGHKDIIAVELWQEDCQEWREMRRAYGGVWDMANPPRGAINLRFLATGDEGQRWVQLRSVIPSDWKAGVAYDSAIQLT
ncbi:expansin-like B1 isoform X2 [Tasmannia lanceolata]|uniref:expansin-like B1 isoform X2 n=1 Tax=Tasmannia lanceolata TaxID=3420 RepID=UPI0040636A09